MRFGRHAFGILLGLCLFSSTFAQPQPPASYIVMLRPGVQPGQVAGRHGIATDHVYQHALNGFAGVIPEPVLNRMLVDPDVIWIEPDQMAFAVARPTKTPPPPQVTPPGIARVGAIPLAVDVDIAIIDTGIDLTHSDLNVVSDVSFVSRTRSGNDDNGHGTHCAGIAAAMDNDIGVIGVAPGARLWAVKVLDRNGSGAYSTVISGVDYVAANAADISVANMSLGGPNSVALNTAIANAVAKGVVFVVAAGNSGANAGSSSPANSPDVLCVSAIVDTDGQGGHLGTGTSYGADDTFASFSNYGEVVDIAAPGVNVYSTYKGNSYATLSGTSMASPHVAGAVARYLSIHNFKPEDSAAVDLVRAMIISLATLQSSTTEGFTGDRDAFAEPLLNVSSY
ncbi:MAG: S8 family serine peptidase [Planctomycetales bacterium]|nr:S8 family serine peptidase [Planctomycetales bacterium]